MNSRKEIPVLLLTGYLGSGKTTLLNKILANQKGIKFAVIVNDIGEVNIDAALIEQGGVVGKKDDSLVALQNGCICCTLKMDLVEQLKEIVDMQKFDYIVIEASGICEPAPIAQTICSIPTLGPQYVKNGVLRLDSIVTVVDALRMKDEFAGGDDLMKDNIDEEDLASLVIQQIEFCNIILLNKAAEVEPKDLDKLKHIIKAIQPKAEIFECNYGDVDLDKIVNTRKFDWETVATSAGCMSTILDGSRRLRQNATKIITITTIMMMTMTMTTMSTSMMNTSIIIITITTITIIITTTMRVRLRNTASAPSCTTAASLSTWDSSTTSWHANGHATW